MAAKIFLFIAKGEAVQVDLTHQVGPGDPTPVDITGWTIVFSLRQRSTDVAVVISKGCTIENGPAGNYRLDLTHAETNIAVGKYLCDFWRTDSGSEAQLAEGPTTIRPSILYGPAA